MIMNCEINRFPLLLPESASPSPLGLNTTSCFLSWHRWDQPRGYYRLLSNLPILLGESGCCTYERGTIMRKGPLIRLCSMRYVIKAMVWIVLPRPISSARMPFRLLLYRDTSHSKPLIWTGREEGSGICRMQITPCETQALDPAPQDSLTSCSHSLWQTFKMND